MRDQLSFYRVVSERPGGEAVSKSLFVIYLHRRTRQKGESSTAKINLSGAGGETYTSCGPREGVERLIPPLLVASFPTKDVIPWTCVMLLEVKYVAPVKCGSVRR